MMIDQKVKDELLETLKMFVKQDCVKARWNDDGEIRNEQFQECRQCILSGCTPYSSDVCSRLSSVFDKLDEMIHMTMEDYMARAEAERLLHEMEAEMFSKLKTVHYAQEPMEARQEPYAVNPNAFTRPIGGVGIIPPETFFGERLQNIQVDEHVANTTTARPITQAELNNAVNTLRRR